MNAPDDPNSHGIQPDDYVPNQDALDDATIARMAIRMPELPETTAEAENATESRTDAPEPPPLTDEPYEYVHPACQGVAFRLAAPTLPQIAMTCAHCGAGLSPRAMSRRHIRETRPETSLT